MPTFPNGASTTDVLNALRDESSISFQNTVPELNQQNFNEYATGVLTNVETRNEWANGIVNRIGLVVMNERSWNNPLAFLKRGMLEMGDTIEEIFTDLLTEKQYKSKTNENDAGKIYASAIPDIYAVFHKVNREGLYEVSFNWEELRKAFVSMRALEQFIDKIYNTLSKSDNRDEFLYMKQLLTVYANRDLFYRVHVEEPTNEATAKALITKVKEFSNLFTFLSRDYNAFNVTNHADKEEQIIFMSSFLDALIDVNVLASAFNMDKTEFLARRIVLDTMPVENAHIILTTRDMFMVYDRLFDIQPLFNPSTLEWKYFYHHHQVLSTSRFENAAIFTSDTVVEPTTVEVKRKTQEDIIKGNSTQFLHTVKGSGGTTTNVSQSVVFDIIGKTDPNTTINENGWLYVGMNEKAEKLTIKAVALHFADISGQLEVTLGVTEDTENGN